MAHSASAVLRSSEPLNAAPCTIHGGRQEVNIIHSRQCFDAAGGGHVVGYRYGQIRAAELRGPQPLVIMAHGFSGTQDRLTDHALYFVESGLSVLTFDYRSFGESDGEPRQVVNVVEQLQDWESTIRFARSLPEVDPNRIALWGSSLGGGHVIATAAADPRLAAVVSQIPFNGFPRRVEGRSAWDNLRLLWAMSVDAVRGRAGLAPRYIPMVGQPPEVAVTLTSQANQHIATLSRNVSESGWQNRVAPRGLFGMLRYRPGRLAHKLVMPLLVCIAENDQVTPEQLTRALADLAPHGKLRRYPGDHFDFYRDPIQQRVLHDQAAFLHEHLT